MADSRLPVLVLGGTGHYGRHTVSALVQRGAPVRVLSRSAASARRLLGEGVEVVEGDVTDAAVLESALRGTRAVVVSLAAMTRSTARDLRAIEHDAVLRVFEAAPSAGVRRVIYLSAYELRMELLEQLGISAVFGMKAEVEAALAKTDLDWTVLGHAPSMEVPFAMLRGDRLNVPGGGPPAFPMVSAIDSGAIAAQAALRDDLGGQRFHITGPEALSFSRAAERIGAVLGRTIRVRAIPLAPIRAFTAVANLFNPYYGYLWASIALLNAFPQDIAAAVPQAHKRLTDTFDYTPVTLEDETRRRLAEGTLTAS